MEPWSWRRRGSEDVACLIGTGPVQPQPAGAWGLKARSPDRGLRGTRHEVCKRKAETLRSSCPGRWYCPSFSCQTPRGQAASSPESQPL